MLDLYLTFVKSYSLLSSAVQVGLLGTFGEALAIRIRTGRWLVPGGDLRSLVAKLVIWAFLGITFKYAFVGFGGFVDAISAKGFWCGGEGCALWWRALSISFFCNLLFGPVMMTFHRWTDNLIERKQMDWASLQKAWWTLGWFWIPAHTITFSLPAHFQVGLAAVWAVALGVILGFYSRGDQPR